MKKTTRSVAVAITAAGLMSPLAFAQTEGQQPQAEAQSVESENAQGTMGGMGGMQSGEMMPMMAQMQEMMETCTRMMQRQMDNDDEQEL